jgi:hypothetical protein
LFLGLKRERERELTIFSERERTIFSERERNFAAERERERKISERVSMVYIAYLHKLYLTL